MDMSGNGGGMVALSWLLIKGIVGSMNLPPEKLDPCRFRSSPLFGKFSWKVRKGGL